VLGLACVLFCDHCQEATAHPERGWRAYMTPDQDGEPFLSVLCPACAEQRVGEDETTWSP
jgi:hypothetical protein